MNNQKQIFVANVERNMASGELWPHCPVCNLPMSDWFVTDGAKSYCFPCAKKAKTGLNEGDLGVMTEDVAKWRKKRTTIQN